MGSEALRRAALRSGRAGRQVQQVQQQVQQQQHHHRSRRSSRATPRGMLLLLLLLAPHRLVEMLRLWVQTLAALAAVWCLLLC